MNCVSTYKVKIKHYNHIFQTTVTIYRNAVDYLIKVCIENWENICRISGSLHQQRFVETLIHRTKQNPSPFYDFDSVFYKMPSYLRRSAISESIGKVSSYKSNLTNWEQNPIGKKPSLPKAGRIFPCLYQDNMYQQVEKYEARVKVFLRNTWDWIPVSLKKSDIDYIDRRCKSRKQCAPTLRKRGKEWFLEFPFEEKVSLKEATLPEERVLAVDLGINNACVCSLLLADGTVLGREFLSLPRENDCLQHAIGRIKKAQQHGARKMPRLWVAAKGINQDIAVKTAAFILEKALQYDATTIVFEHLDLGKKARGSKKQKLHLWKARSVQTMVTGKAHRHGIRIRRVNAWGTSRLAFDGSGPVMRGAYLQDEKEKYNYSMCVFATGKQYHCDLNASYNIGARYLVREILKSLPETVRLDMEAKVPSCIKRSTCTLSTLIHLNAELTA